MFVLVAVRAVNMQFVMPVMVLAPFNSSAATFALKVQDVNVKNHG